MIRKQAQRPAAGLGFEGNRTGGGPCEHAKPPPWATGRTPRLDRRKGAEKPQSNQSRPVVSTPVKGKGEQLEVLLPLAASSKIGLGAGAAMDRSLSAADAALVRGTEPAARGGRLHHVDVPEGHRGVLRALAPTSGADKRDTGNAGLTINRRRENRPSPARRKTVPHPRCSP